MKFQSRIARPLPWSGLNSDVARKACVCESVLTEARQLSEGGNFEGPLNQLVARACEILDDIDEVLITLDPERDMSDFAAAANLHRELEQIQAIVPPRRRSRVAPRQPRPR